MLELTKNWFLLQTKTDQFSHPEEIEKNQNWIPAIVPGTVAQSLEMATFWDIEQKKNFDGYDSWYKTSFSLQPDECEQSGYLKFDGLATIVEVWLNGAKILSSNNMFITHNIEVNEYLQSQNELILCFRSLEQSLSQRLPRPRWKTKLVDYQQLRWFRTTLLGRIPGWTPPIQPVGPWQAISLVDKSDPRFTQLQAQLSNDIATVKFNCELSHANADSCAAKLIVGNTAKSLNVTQFGSNCRIEGELTFRNPELWWPHTHGQPYLYDVELDVTINGVNKSYSLTPLGFKQVELDTTDDAFSLSINGKTIFSRGACWTINDIVSLNGDYSKLVQTLTLMRDAGANLIRVGGTMVYEQEAFYNLCDKLGILVWQDFMFANMDYPFDDENFLSSVKLESKQQVLRLCQHACVTLYCGNSEIEQQVAMLGLDKNIGSHDFFTKDLPDICIKYHSNIPYVSSTPTNGALPFHTNKGLSHYYGVGAYLRPVSELRSHAVKFTSECLGFSNIPVAKTRNSVLNGNLPVTHHPKWKERTPRDNGPGWDFEDVRDHYLNTLFLIDPVKLRSFDPERYIELSEIVTGEMMSQVFSEWRSRYSYCQGGIVWFLKDFWPGAGWGIIDSNGLPKACYYYLKRSWQNVQVSLTNETLNGIHIHISNESEQVFSGKLSLKLINKQSDSIADVSVDVQLEPGSIKCYESDTLLKGFFDAAYIYRFGPPKHMVVYALLEDADGEEISSSCFFSQHQQAISIIDADIKATLTAINDDASHLKISSSQFLYAVKIDIPGYLPSDNYFHLPSGKDKNIHLTRIDSTVKKCKGYATAVNIQKEIRIK